ncbi:MULTISPECIES: type II toxin-antitoxin system HipA family toxin [unclassified Microbulbifer]|uniref:type II toxin-antitoxin system HipA family toxin n=1 Tax=unclassified Microbulbifer TaxID=2619833 RepID=UPI0027E41F90|nr:MULTISPECIES: type II toxin-antitoxin system HipA family toxin [unclassified Microbulbifer]
MNSERRYREAYVWIWLPGQTEPVVAGKLEADRGLVHFNYGRSYLDRADDPVSAIPIYLPELPLKAGRISLQDDLREPGCIRDAAPDAWGQRVILNKLMGARGAGADTAELGLLAYLLESGSDRIGALDFQASPSEYLPRTADGAPLEELMESAHKVEQGIPLSSPLDQALFHGSSIGGARPKVLIQDESGKYIAKFSSTSDLYNVIKAEYIAMRLAALAGITTAKVKLVKAVNREVLLVERFDREKTPAGWTRKIMISALTLLGLDAMRARYASYADLAEIVRHRFDNPKETLRELYRRLCFNILCGNTDDHARNHAAFWDGKSLQLTPAYDICPQSRTGQEASQAMEISGGNRMSCRSACVEAAAHFQLEPAAAAAVFNDMVGVIEGAWKAVCDEAELGEVDRKLLWGRQFLNPFAFG